MVERRSQLISICVWRCETRTFGSSERATTRHDAHITNIDSVGADRVVQFVCSHRVCWVCLMKITDVLFRLLFIRSYATRNEKKLYQFFSLVVALYLLFLFFSCSAITIRVNKITSKCIFVIYFSRLTCASAPFDRTESDIESVRQNLGQH